ncbi:aromatic amino acid lyase [Streptomyces sp. Tu 2975]|nr:aromatic amino acid lyase [Streptomyces sp. Tu 2975]QIP82730.1 aromatic amino acid lyase [Streptomyces sp. Tu 2975]
MRHGANRWTVFDGGMAQFCPAALIGEVDPFSERISEARPHLFVNWREM